MRKFFTFLLALAASVGMSYALTPLADDVWDESTKTLTVKSNPDDWSSYMYNSEIQHLVFSDAVTSIGGFAFFGCANLSTITIPSSVATIGNNAFYGCTLTSVTNYATTPQSINNDMFQYMSNPYSCLLYVPSGSKIAYNGATGWNALKVTEMGPTYLDASFAIDFRTDPYDVVAGGPLPTEVTVEGSMNTGDAAHGYRLPVITIPVKAGNYKVTMGTCTYSNQDGFVKNEDGSNTFATLATNNGTCYHQNTTTNVVSELFNVPSDQIIKVYGAEYTPYFAIEKLAAVPTFTDFEINFQHDPYQVVSGTKPEGTEITGTPNGDISHGYQNVVVTVPMEAGTYRLTLGTCQYGNGAGDIKDVLNQTLASFNQNTGACYHNNTAQNIISTTFSVDVDQNITIDCGQYTPYMKLEKITAYKVVFALGDAEGVAPAAVDVTIGDALTMPVNKTMYKDGYTLTGWTDGVNTYAIGEPFTPATDAVLTPVFSANAAAIADATETVTVRWYFGKSNEAPDIAWQGNSGFLVAQATLGGNPIDVRLAIDATAGKFSNAGRTDEWAQVNATTILSFPGREDAVVTVNSYNNNPEHYAIDATAGTLTCNTNDYYSYLEVVYPAPAPTYVIIGTYEDPKNAGVYYTTFFDSSVKYELPAGVEAYVATLSTNDLVLTKIAEGGQVMPANTAVILKANAASITLTVSDEAAVSFSANNSLLGVDVATAAPANCYVLSGTNEYGVGFYQINSENLKAHKAYVIYNGTAAPARMRFIFNNGQVATDVDQITNEQSPITNKVMINGVLYIIKNGVYYNAQGQVIK